MSQASILRSLTEQHPESVAQLFRAYQVDARPTYSNLVKAHKQYGEPFLADLNNIFGEFSNYDDTPKKSGFVTALNGVAHMFEDKRELELFRDGRIQNRPIIHLENGQRIYADQYPLLYTSELRFPDPQQAQHSEHESKGFHLPDRIFGMNKSMFLVLAGMLTVLVFMEMFQRKH